MPSAIDPAAPPPPVAIQSAYHSGALSGPPRPERALVICGPPWARPRGWAERRADYTLVILILEDLRASDFYNYLKIKPHPV